MRRDRCKLAFVTVVLWATVSQADVLNVPSEFPTIQSALDSLNTGDTVLVSLGEYYEGLIAPATMFWLLGNVLPDSGEYPRPVIDVSMSPDSLHRACLRAPFGSDIQVERFHFRNRIDMSNRTDVAGIRVLAQQIRVVSCLFDSVHGGVRLEDNLAGTLELQDCVFRHNSGTYAYARDGAIEALRCNFEGGGAWYHVYGSSGTHVTECRFAENPDHSFLSAYGHDIEIRLCTFGPGLATGFHAVELAHFNGTFADNVITGLNFGPATVYIEIDCRGPCQIANNTFRSLRRSQPGAFSPPLRTFCWEETNTFAYVVENNVFTACSTTTGAKGIYFEDTAHLIRNRFTFNRPRTNALAAMVGELADSSLIEGNLFLDNGKAESVVTGSLDARWNWWGHETGPYHPVENPDGLGDEVGDNILFDPWYADTTFLPVEDVANTVAQNFSLSAYPNPFNSSIRIILAGFTGSDFEITLHNLLGQVVDVIHRGPMTGGDLNYQAPAFLSSGVYFVKASDKRGITTKKVVLMK